MSNAKLNFEKNIDTLQESKTIINFLTTHDVSIDYSDLLRWQWVQIISAMDKFFHDLIIEGISYRIVQDKLTPRLSATQFSFNTLQSFDNHAEIISQFTSKLENYSMQNSKNIADSLSLVWNQKDKWRIIGHNSSLSIDVKTSIDLISSRRNQIVHQADYQSESLSRSPISVEDVTNCQSTVQDVVATTFRLISDELSSL